MIFFLAVTQFAVFSVGTVIFPVFVLLVIGLAAKCLPGLLDKRRTNGCDGPLPYKSRRYLFSKAERSFYEVLRRVVAPDFVIFAKVRLWDLVSVPNGTHQWQAHVNRVQSKHVDFVICEVQSMRVVGVVELDDSSHSATARKERDLLVDRILLAAGIPLVRVVASKGYATSHIQDLLGDVLKGTANTEVLEGAAGT